MKNFLKYACIALMAGFLVTGGPTYDVSADSDLDYIANLISGDDTVMIPAPCSNYDGYDCSGKAEQKCTKDGKNCTAKCELPSPNPKGNKQKKWRIYCPTTTHDVVESPSGDGSVDKF